MIVTGSLSASAAAPADSGCPAPAHRPTLRRAAAGRDRRAARCRSQRARTPRAASRRRSRPARLRNRAASPPVPRRLPRVQRHDDQAFGHRRQVDRGPVRCYCRRAARSDRPCAVPAAAKNARAAAIDSEQLRRRDGSRPSGRKFLEHHALGRLCQPLQNVFEEIHGSQARHALQFTPTACARLS